MAGIPQRFYVLGAGATGLLVGSALGRAGLPVTLLRRKRQRGSTDSQHGPIWGPASVKVNPTYPGAPSSYEQAVDMEEITEDGPPIERLVVTTKSYDVKSAISSIHSRLSSDAVAVLLPNGMGYVEDCLEAGLLRRDQIVLGTLTHGAIRRGEYEVEHTGFGQCFLGIPASSDGVGGAAEAQSCGSVPAREATVSDLAKMDLGCSVEGDIEGRLWKKLCVNACINPLTALLECRNGRIHADQDLQAVVGNVCAEVASVMKAAGRPCSAEELVAFVNRVAVDTAGNQSSMLLDMKMGRPTEVGYVNGYIVRRALALSVPVPSNRLLLHLVRSKEQGAR